MDDRALNIVQFPADTGGCGHYRMFFPQMCLRSITKDLRFIESMKLIGDPTFFRDIRQVRLQRQVNDIQYEYFFKFLFPICKSLGTWLTYEVDDVIGHDDIPKWNHGRDAYENQKFFYNVKEILAAVDIMTVTTEALKRYFIEKFFVEADKIIVLPNLLPKWWIDPAYNIDRRNKVWEETKKKPKICLPLSTSHYDLTGKNGYVDDLTEVSKFIRETWKIYDWHFIVHVPKQLEDLVYERKIFVDRGCDILNYPGEFAKRNYTAIVAPLINNVFNRCKSNIKLIENWGIGIPVLGQKIECYDKYTEWTFRDNNELDNQLRRLLNDKDKYLKVIKSNRKIVESGDHNASKGWWLENNIQKWTDIFMLPQKSLLLDIRNKKVNTQDNGVKIEL